MHIALLSPTWPLKTYPNGIVTYVHWMREELRRVGHRVSVFTRVLAEPDEGVYLVGQSRMYRARAWLRSKRQPADHAVFHWDEAFADALRAVHRAHPIDVLEMEESFGWAAGVERRTSIPTVVKLHGPAFMSLVEEELDTPFAQAKIDKEGAALRKMQVLTSPARRTLDDTIVRYDLSPPISQHIVNSLSLPASAPLWDLGRCDRRMLLFVGRFDKRKGGDTVLQAFALLLRANPDLTLVFVGPDAGISGASGKLTRFDEMKASIFPASASERVVFRGRLAPGEIYQLRTRAFVTLIASRWENQSYTALEAMLQGCPLVSTDAGGQGEIIDDGVTGLLAPTDDPAGLCAKVQSLLVDPDFAAALGSRARRYALEHHSPEFVVSQTLEVYSRAIELKKGARR